MSGENNRFRYIFIILFFSLILFGTIIPKGDNSYRISYATHDKTASSLPLVDIHSESVNILQEIIIPARTTLLMSLFEKKGINNICNIWHLFILSIFYNICPDKIYFYIIGIYIYLLHYIGTIKYIHKKDGKKQVCAHYVI